MRALLTTTGILFFAGCFVGAQTDSTVELPFWAKKGARKDPRVIRIIPHDLCSGYFAYCRVSEIPDGNTDPYLRPDIACEFSKTKKKIKTWSIPAEYSVVGVRGQELLVSPWRNKDPRLVIVISMDRKVRIERLRQTPPQRLAAETDVTPQDFKGDCVVATYVDLLTGQHRTIAYSEPCT